jgi:hypothetical protein
MLGFVYRFLLVKYCVGTGFTHRMRTCPRSPLCQGAHAAVGEELAADIWRAYLVSCMEAFTGPILLSSGAISQFFLPLKMGGIGFMDPTGGA